MAARQKKPATEIVVSAPTEPEETPGAINRKRSCAWAAREMHPYFAKLIQECPTWDDPGLAQDFAAVWMTLSDALLGDAGGLKDLVALMKKTRKQGRRKWVQTVNAFHRDYVREFPPGKHYQGKFKITPQLKAKFDLPRQMDEAWAYVRKQRLQRLRTKLTMIDEAAARLTDGQLTTELKVPPNKFGVASNIAVQCGAFGLNDYLDAFQALSQSVNR